MELQDEGIQSINLLPFLSCNQRMGGGNVNEMIQGTVRDGKIQTTHATKQTDIKALRSGKKGFNFA